MLSHTATKSPAGSAATAGARLVKVVKLLTANSPPCAVPPESKRWPSIDPCPPSQTTTKPPAALAASAGSYCPSAVCVLTWNCEPAGEPSEA